MEVRQGFKRTEIGIFPLDWTVLNVSQFAEVKRGAGSQAIQYANESAGIRFIRINDFFENQPVFVRSTEDVMKFTLGERDILFAGTGNTAGASYIPPKEWYGLPHSYNAPRIRISRNVSKSYVFHAFQSHYMDAQQRAQFVGAAQPFLDTKAISGFLVAIPKSEKEQKEIATALSDVDALIAGLEKLIAKKRDLKQAAMQQLLNGQTRLPGFSGEWTYLSLGELCSLKSGMSITSSGISDQGAYRCFGGNGLRGFTPTFTHNGNHALIGRQGALCGNVVGVQGKFFASEHALVVTPRIGVAIEWLTFVLGRMNLNQYSESSAQPGLSAFKLLILEVLTPPSEAEQAAVAEALASFDTELGALESRLAKTRELKQGMMQELLTGRTRLV